MATQRFCFSCDLKDDPQLIEEYKQYHAPGNAWPEITQSIKDAGIVDMQIYLTGNRMFMIMEVDGTFDPQKKSRNGCQQPQGAGMGTVDVEFQQGLPWTKDHEKWIALENYSALKQKCCSINKSGQNTLNNWYTNPIYLPQSEYYSTSDHL